MSDVQQSFGRIVNIKVFATITGESGGQPTISFDAGYTTFSSVAPDGLPGYRIRGKVNKVEAAASVISNNINFSIYNLGPSSRALVESKVGTKIIVEAGYSKNPKQIFFGNILWAKTHKEGPDYVTEMIAGDGSFAITNGNVNQSFSGAVSYEQAINTCIDALAKVGVTRGVVKGIPGGNYNSGLVLNGSPADNLKQICDKLNLRFSIQNGQVTILPSGNDLGSPSIVLTPFNGLVGIPEVRTQGLIGPATSVNQNTPTSLITFKCLMRPEFEMYQKVTLQSKFINGDYIAARVTHDFDSWEGPFYTECECASA